MMGMGMGMPPAKPNDFRGSFRRLFGTLRPERPLVIGVIVLAVNAAVYARIFGRSA